MSRKETEDEFNARIDRENAEAQQRANCDHYNCEPVEWYWSGAIQTMHCRDCGEREWRSEEPE